MKENARPRISILHCINAFGEGAAVPGPAVQEAELNFIRLPCSSMVKDIYLMRAFEAGADLAAVLVCMEGSCRYVEGNLRAKKRVQRVQALLDEIGMDGRRLALFNLAARDLQAAGSIIAECCRLAASLGPNPARNSVSENRVARAGQGGR